MNERKRPEKTTAQEKEVPPRSRQGRIETQVRETPDPPRKNLPWRPRPTKR